jgi:hypothetical protein
MSTMKRAVNDDRMGRAYGFNEDGLIRAEVMGPGHYQSSRKKTKAWRNQTLILYTPPRKRDHFPATNHGISRAKLAHMSKEVRVEIERLNWRPSEPRDAVTRLGDLAR